jgi:acyl-CoA synthetase (NDP forming)
VINLGTVGRSNVLKILAKSIQKADPTYSSEFINQIYRDFQKVEKDFISQTIALMERYNKPVYGVSMLPDEKHQTVYPDKKYTLKCVFFPTPERAVRVFAKMVQYQKFLKNERDS